MKEVAICVCAWSFTMLSCGGSRPVAEAQSAPANRLGRELVEVSLPLRESLFELRDKLIKSATEGKKATVIDLLLGSDHPAIQASKIEIILDQSSRAIGMLGHIEGILKTASVSPKPALTCETLAGIAEGSLLAAKRDKAEAVVTVAERLAEKTDPESTSISGSVAVLSAQLGRWETAKALCDRVRRPAAQAMTLNGIAEALLAGGRKDEAIETALKAREIARTLGREDNGRSELGRAAKILAKAGNAEEALRTARIDGSFRSAAAGFAEAVQLEDARRVARMERDPIDRYYAVHDIMVTLLKNSRNDEAVRLIDDARTAVNAIPPNDRDYPRMTFVSLLTMMGRYDDAVAESEKIKGPEHSYRGRAFALASVALARAGKADESRKYTTQAIAALPSGLDTSSVRFREIAADLVQIGAHKEAIPYLEEGLKRDRQDKSTFGRYLGLALTADAFLDAKDIATGTKLKDEVDAARKAHKWERPEDDSRARAVVSVLAARSGQFDAAKAAADGIAAGDWPTAYKLWAYSVLMVETELQRNEMLKKNLAIDYFRLPGTP